MAFCVPHDATTLEGFRAWAMSDEFPDRGRISYIDGQIVIDMSPEHLESHNKIKSAISSVLFQLAQAMNLGTFYGDRSLLTNNGADLSTEPDAMFATWETIRTGRLRHVPSPSRPGDSMELAGSPDMVLEIVSHTTIKKDTRDLRKAYHRAGIPEYWLVNGLGQAIDFQILIRKESDYEPVAPQDGWLRSLVFGQSFRLERDRDPVGHWRYKLHARR